MGLFLAEFFRDLWRQVLAFFAKLPQKLDSFIAGFGLDPNKLAQVGHFSVAYGLTFTAYVVGWCFGFWYAGLIVGGLLGGPWVIWKEAYRDTKPPENAPFLWNGFEDAAFYWAGIALATALAAALGMAFPR